MNDIPSRPPCVVRLPVAFRARQDPEQLEKAARRALEIRQLLTLKARQEELETEFIATPATTWRDASERAIYLIGVLATASSPRDTRRKKLIASVLADLSGADIENQ